MARASTVLPELQERRATVLAATLLAEQAPKYGTPAAAAALGRALASTLPSSEHGQLLARALRPTAGRRPEPEHAVLWLASRGMTPTAAAVASRLECLEARRARAARRSAAAEKQAERDGARAAAYVASVVTQTGAGPTWRELACAMGWPDRLTWIATIERLVAAGWLHAGTEQRSLRPGRRLSRFGAGQ